MNRRHFLTAGAALGAAGLAGRYFLMPPGRSARLAPPDELAVAFLDSLDGEQRRVFCRPHDDPWRQYHNRGVQGAGGRVFGQGLPRESRRLLNDLFHAGLSEAGRAMVPDQHFLYWPGIHLMKALVCGDPRDGAWQLILSGPHLNLRVGGASPEGAAFGGPQVWGEQRSDGVPGMPRNIHRPQFEAGQALIAALPKTLFEEAFLPVPPVQTDIEPRGRGGPFPGACVGDFPAPARERTRELIDSVFGLWPAADADFARHCLEENGGLAALHFAVYGEGAAEGYFPVFRLEGPCAVIHWRGWPHLHAFCNVNLDPAHPLRTGKVLGQNPRMLEGASAARFLERVLVERTGADLADYPTDSVAARLPAGPVRTGDVYTFESWLDRVALVEAAPGDLVPALAARLTPEQRARPRVTVATAGYVADERRAERIGAGNALALPAPLSVRDALLEHIAEHGFG